MFSISARSSSSIPSSPAGIVLNHSGRGLLHQQHFLYSVDFLKFYFDDFEVGSLHGTSDKAGLDRQFAMSAVDKHKELHARRTAMVEKCIERCTNGASG